MKKLTDIRLINWHGFYDETIPVDGSVLVAGDNGSGKSSLLDAIYYLLSGGDANHFNSAANEKTDRTLETYMRGRTGESGHPYLREGKAVVSHIALQFLDEKKAENFLVGVALELQEGQRDVLKTFYYVPNHALDDSLFKDKEGHVLNFRLMEAEAPMGTFHLLGDTQKKIRASLYDEVLEIDGKKYLDLLPKAISFKPIDDVHEFVYRFLMPERDVDLTAMRTVIHSLNELSHSVKEEEEKKEALRAISEKGNEYTKKKKEASLYAALATSLASTSLEDERERLLEEKEALISAGKELENKRSSLLRRKEECNRDLYALESDSSFSAYKNIDDAILTAEKKEKEAENQARAFESKLAREASLAHALSISVELLPFLEKHDYQGLQSRLHSYQNLFRKKRDEIRSSYSAVESSLLEEKKEARRLQLEIEELAAGRSVYPEAFVALRKKIIERVKAETGEDIDIRPFLELIDLREGEEEWRSAIESLLGDRRFDLFVDPKYYPIALSVLDEEKEKHPSGIGLVDLERLPAEVEVKENSLAKKLTALTYDAERYLNLLLGRMEAVDDAIALQGKEEALSPSGVAYYERAARSSSSYGSVPYIGAASRHLQLEEKERELDELTHDIELGESEAKDTYALIERLEHSNLMGLLQEPNRWALLEEARGEVALLRGRKESLQDESSDLTYKGRRLAELRKLLSELEGEVAEIDEEIKENASRLGSDETRLHSLEGAVKGKEEELIAMLKKEGLTLAFEDFKKDKELASKEASAESTRLLNELVKSERELRSLMGSYIRRFSFDETNEIDALPHFLEEYDKVANHDLVSHIDKLERASDKAAESFQNDYIAKIRSSIEEEKKHIKKLNAILAGRPFGSEGDVYEFLIAPAKDPDFRPYYDIFASKEDFEKPSLFTENLSKKNEALIASLYDRFTREDADEKLIRSFTDYRNFMDYDIKITDREGRTYRFSEISKSKSGGETQTPFYVIIAASFDQLLREDRGEASPGCLVMFDEAFEKMDQSHVESMMRYFRELSIQPLLAVPGNQAKAIAPYVDTKVALVKQGGRIIASSLLKAAN